VAARKTASAKRVTIQYPYFVDKFQHARMKLGDNLMGIKQSSLLAIIMLMLASCAGRTNAASKPLPGIDISADRVNTYIKLFDAPELQNSHKNGELLSFQIINLSSETIVFSENYGIKLFTNKDGNWVEISNNSYNAGDTFYLPTRDSYPLGDLIDTAPYVVDLASPTTVRVIIVGHRENDNEQVGAYIDVTITP
jgi:hypothetical protein